MHEAVKVPRALAAEQTALFVDIPCKVSFVLCTGKAGRRIRDEQLSTYEGTEGTSFASNGGVEQGVESGLFYIRCVRLALRRAE